ncbi:NF038122 family metalloprotease [Magnetococcus sp. PR-3]|uniref:NF038122 family metalloprotease n=1 Tax=Magnetococcus sp. PR-3 TaxID=3120355 RepID=UPI002FCE5A66
MMFLRLFFVTLFSSTLWVATPVRALTFDINYTSYTAEQQAAFIRGYTQWTDIITDNVTVIIDTSFASLGGSTLGAASSTYYTVDFDTVRGWMVADAADESDEAITTYLPDSSSINVTTDPDGTTVNTSLMKVYKANMRGLGITSGYGIDWTASDATIQYSSDYSWDYDNSDGVTAGSYDFETVVAHEIGHALGFASGVDTADTDGSPIYLTPLDMFRFSTAADDPTTTDNFTTATRYMIPDASNNVFFDDLYQEYLFSTGVYEGDGQQASHWKDGQSPILGIMDPTLASATAVAISDADQRALDVIGWDIATSASLNASASPIPATGWVMLLGLGLLWWRFHPPQAMPMDATLA